MYVKNKDLTKKRGAKPSGKLSFGRGDVKTFLTPKEVKLLCGNKDKYPIIFDISSSHYRIENTQFFDNISPNTLKEYE